jgi:hypothetical protein
VVGGQLVISSALADAVTLAGDAPTLTALGLALGNRNSTVGTTPPGMQATTLDAIEPSGAQERPMPNLDRIAGSVPALHRRTRPRSRFDSADQLLTQSAAAASQTMTITIGANPPLTITFGTGGTQVSTSPNCRPPRHAERRHRDDRSDRQHQGPPRA